MDQNDVARSIFELNAAYVQKINLLERKLEEKKFKMNLSNVEKNKLNTYSKILPKYAAYKSSDLQYKVMVESLLKTIRSYQQYDVQMAQKKLDSSLPMPSKVDMYECICGGDKTVDNVIQRIKQHQTNT